MILLLVLAIVALRVVYSVGEMYYERDWPRRTWKGLAISVVLLMLCFSVFA